MRRRRMKMSRRRDKKVFKKTARKVHKRNLVRRRSMRGGTRL